jgi:hypothetical protein
MALFIAVQCAFPHGFTVNSMARLGLLFSMNEGTFAIDPFVSDANFRKPTYGKTWDWAKAPNGRFYCNKAPGPSMLALPFYWPVDRWLTRGAATEAERNSIRLQNLVAIQFFLSILLQVLPLLVVITLALRRMREAGISERAIEVACVAALLGNSAAVYSNVFFGHAMTAWLLVALFLAMHARRYLWIGFFLGCLPLFEYPLAIVIPVAAWVLRKDLAEKPGEVIVDMIMGAIIPVSLFFIYHTVCFGGPLTPAMRYNIPVFRDVRRGPNFLGLFHVYPRPSAVFGLLFGGRLGILWTQPWVLVGVVAGWRWLRREDGLKRTAGELAVGSLAALTLVIGAFHSWHGGGSAGPRYLCALFPLCGLILGLSYDRLSPRLRRLALAGLWVGVLFALVALAIDIAPGKNSMIWLHFWKRLTWRTAGSVAAWMTLMVAVWNLERLGGRPGRSEGRAA